MNMETSNRQSIFSGSSDGLYPLANDNGSIMVLVLMILVVMTAIGIVSSNTVITENRIVRNAAIHRENINLVESALMEGLQRFMQLDPNNPDNFDEDFLNDDWINPPSGAFDNAPGTQGWYETSFQGKVLGFNNSLEVNMPILTTRGEDHNGNLRVALVGWEAVEGDKVDYGELVMHRGRCVAEYVSLNAAGNDNGYGLLRMEIGLRREWINN